MMKNLPAKHPVTIISFLVLGVVAFFLSTLLAYVFTVSVILGIALLIIYIALGVIAYRAAHVHTGGGHNETR